MIGTSDGVSLKTTDRLPLSAFVRSTDRSVAQLETPLTTDLFGTELRYYAVVDGRVQVSASVRALCGLLGRVTLNPIALAESLAFGLVLRDETVVREVRSIPPHSTLHPDGTLAVNEGPRPTIRVTDAVTAVRRMRGILSDIVAELEPRFDVHCVGYTGGKDSRILAALPKSIPDRWHWLAVSGADDAEQRGSRLHAERLGLTHYAWMEWTPDFLDGVPGEPAHRVSADLANGIGAVSDFTLLRNYFERYRASVLGRGQNDTGVALWIGTLADALIGGTYLSPPAATIWDALAPRTASLPRLLAPGVQEMFADRGSWYRSDPYSPLSAGSEERGRLIRLFTRGRSYVCKSTASLDRVCPTQINPYLHPALIELGLETDPRLLADDALRRGVLAELGPGLDEPSAFGTRAPAYSKQVFHALEGEVRSCTLLEGLVEPALLEAMRAGRFPDLSVPASATSPAGNTAPVYRSHTSEPQPVIRSLRDYEHLLVYTTMLNLLARDGVIVSAC